MSFAKKPNQCSVVSISIGPKSVNGLSIGPTGYIPLLLYKCVCNGGAGPGSGQEPLVGITRTFLSLQSDRLWTHKTTMKEEERRARLEMQKQLPKYERCRELFTFKMKGHDTCRFCSKVPTCSLAVSFPLSFLFGSSSFQFHWLLFQISTVN